MRKRGEDVDHDNRWRILWILSIGGKHKDVGFVGPKFTLLYQGKMIFRLGRDWLEL